MNVVVIEGWYFSFFSLFIHVSSKVGVILIKVYQNYIPCANFIYGFTSSINEISYNFTEKYLYVLTFMFLWVYRNESP
jgi:hypothetical protein